MNEVHMQIERLKKVYGVRTDVALADAMKKDKNTIGSWKKRGAVPDQALKMAALEESVSMEWLKSGEGKMELVGAEDIDKLGVIGGLLSDERSVRIVQLLPYAPKAFIDQMIERLEEFKRLSAL